jgi:hypothetical protein
MDATYNLSGGFKPTMKRFADLDGPDFFPTPAWATHALIDNEKFMGDIWEPACGDGAMSRVLAQTGQQVISSDLYRRGFGEIGVDFLDNDRRADNIVTNPRGGHFLKEQIGRIRSFHAAPRIGFGCSASALPFIRPAQK